MLTSQLMLISQLMVMSQLMQLMLVSRVLSCQLEDFGSDVLHQQPGQLRRSQVQVGWALLPNNPPMN